jgi:hypothetical protein
MTYRERTPHILVRCGFELFEREGDRFALEAFDNYRCRSIFESFKTSIKPPAFPAKRSADESPSKAFKRYPNTRRVFGRRCRKGRDNLKLVECVVLDHAESKVGYCVRSAFTLNDARDAVRRKPVGICEPTHGAEMANDQPAIECAGIRGRVLGVQPVSFKPIVIV